MGIWSYIGIGIVILVVYRFFKQLGKGLPILELLLLIAGLQWVVGPIIEYTSPSAHYKYYMYVTQASYMAFVVPSYLIFALIILFSLKKTSKVFFNLEVLKNYSKYGLIIFLIGVFFDLFGGLLPGGLKFLAFILANFRFVGAIVLYYSENKKLKRIFYFILFYLLAISVYKGLFHDFILWSTFFYMFWSLKHKPSLFNILLTVIVAGIFMVTLQTAKSAYRTQAFSDNSGNKFELFVSLMISSLFEDETNVVELDDGIDNNVRLNQGWIISAILDHIPRNQNYLNGSTIKDAVFASILPRVLNPNKAEAGGQENFRKFTGLELSTGTSMGISVLGESYGNFGLIGGMIFMGVFGLFLGRIWLFLLKKTSKNIILIAFTPLIFLQVVKAETELVVVLNHLIKSMIVVFLFIWFAKKYWKWEFNK